MPADEPRPERTISSNPFADAARIRAAMPLDPVGLSQLSNEDRAAVLGLLYGGEIDSFQTEAEIYVDARDVRRALAS